MPLSSSFWQTIVALAHLAACTPSAPTERTAASAPPPSPATERTAASAPSPSPSPVQPAAVTGAAKGLALSCRSAEASLELTGVTLRRSATPHYAAEGRWNAFEGDFTFVAGTVRHRGRMAGNRNADYVFLDGYAATSAPGNVPAVEVTVGYTTGDTGRLVKWDTDKKVRGSTVPERASSEVTCTGSLLTAPVPPK